MSSLAGVAAALAAPPVENWGQLSWGDDAEKESSAVKDGKDEECESKGKTVSGPVLKLLSLPKRQQQTSGAPANATQKTIIQIPVSAISGVAATTKNDLSISLQPKSSATTVPGINVPLELTSVRFAIPNVCIGHERTEEAGREVLVEAQSKLREYQRRVLGKSNAAGGGSDDQGMMTGNRHKDECVIAVLDDLTLSFPSGRFKLVLTNYYLLLEEKKRTGGEGGAVTMVPLAEIVQLYLCDIPSNGVAARSVETDGENVSQYVVVILRNPLRVRASTYNHIVITCPAGFVLDEEHAWSCELKTQEEIDRVLASIPHKQNAAKGATQEPSAIDTFKPTITGRVSELLIRVIKVVAGVKAVGGHNKEYQTRAGNSVMRCLFQGGEGLLYVLQTAFLFLHRPATRILYTDIHHIEVDESEHRGTTFQMAVYGNFGKRGRSSTSRGPDKVIFASLPATEREGLLSYLSGKMEVVRKGGALGTKGSDDSEESDSNEESEDDESSDEDDSFDDEDEDEEDEDEVDRKKRKRSPAEGEKKGGNKEHKRQKDK